MGILLFLDHLTYPTDQTDLTDLTDLTHQTAVRFFQTRRLGK